MPKGDRTGPMGAGPMSGRKAGFCRRASNPADGNRGWRQRQYMSIQQGPKYATGYPALDPSGNPEDEEESIRDQIRTLQSELNVMTTRRDEIGNREK